MATSFWEMVRTAKAIAPHRRMARNLSLLVKRIGAEPTPGSLFKLDQIEQQARSTLDDLNAIEASDSERAVATRQALRATLDEIPNLRARIRSLPEGQGSRPAYPRARH